MKLLLTSLAVFSFIAVVALEARSVQGPGDPVVVAAVAPVYAEVFFQMKAQGEVIVEVKINSSGDVVNATMVQGQELLRAPSVQAARRWKFQPSEAASDRVVNLTFSYRAFYKGQKPAAEDTPVFYPPYKVEVSKSLGAID